MKTKDKYKPVLGTVSLMGWILLAALYLDRGVTINLIDIPSTIKSLALEGVYGMILVLSFYWILKECWNFDLLFFVSKTRSLEVKK